MDKVREVIREVIRARYGISTENARGIIQDWMTWKNFACGGDVRGDFALT